MHWEGNTPTAKRMHESCKVSRRHANPLCEGQENYCG